MDDLGCRFDCCYFVLPDRRRCVAMSVCVDNIACLRYYFAGGTAAGHPLLENRVTKFVSDISMEIYLSHMVVFRVIEKTGLNQMFGNGVLQYIVAVLLVLAVTMVFSVVMKKFINVSENKISILLTANTRKG